ncbi:MAG: hypothetical protein KF901_26630 [Myxococcales bacterium]|nr:hypothetical protein [Myxococcales bacterium]
MAALACGGAAEPERERAPTSVGAEVAEEGPAGVRRRDENEIPRTAKPWGEMDGDERGRFMGEAVVPYMRALFREYDEERYARFNCASCHGPNASERAYAMPSPELMALHPSGSDEQRAMVEAHPRMVQFMFQHVVPAMRTMIGEREFDPATGEGFSCYFCHPRAE